MIIRGISFLLNSDIAYHSELTKSEWAATYYVRTDSVDMRIENVEY